MERLETEHTRVCFSGKMKSGKDTACDHLVSKLGGEKIHMFASGYAFVSWLLLYPLLGLKIDAEHKTKFERWLLQFVGQWGRTLFGKDIWLNKTLKLIEKTPGNVFVTGVRFPNEIERLRSIGIRSIHIDRPLDARLAAGAFNIDHETETGLDNYNDFDFKINNNGDLISFIKKVDTYKYSDKLEELGFVGKKNGLEHSRGHQDVTDVDIRSRHGMVAFGNEQGDFEWKPEPDMPKFKNQFGHASDSIEDYTKSVAQRTGATGIDAMRNNPDYLATGVYKDGVMQYERREKVLEQLQKYAAMAGAEISLIPVDARTNDSLYVGSFSRYATKEQIVEEIKRLSKIAGAELLVVEDENPNIDEIKAYVEKWPSDENEKKAAAERVLREYGIEASIDELAKQPKALDVKKLVAEIDELLSSEALLRMTKKSTKKSKTPKKSKKSGKAAARSRK